MSRRAFRDSTLRTKLILSTMAVSTVALVVACGLFTAYDYAVSRAALVASVQTDANLVGGNCTAAIAFADANDAAQILSTLRNEPAMEAACVFDANGQRLATYYRAAPFQLPEAVVGAASHRFGPDFLELFAPVMQGDRRVGTVYLRSNLDGLHERMRGYAAMFGVVLLAASAVAFLLVRRVQKVIAGPIEDLSQVASRISVVQDYSVRATKTADDELGVLVDCFNGMLAQIQQRDRQLTGVAEMLEQQVAARTAELAGQKAELAAKNGLLDNVLSLIPMAIFWKDRQSRYVGCNQGFLQAIGRTSVADVIGKDDYDLPWTREESDAYRRDDAEVMSTGVAKLNLEETARLADGTQISVLTNKVPMRDPQGNVTGVLCVYQDQTQRKRHEVELQRAKEAAEAASRAKTAFLANMSHEIRTPMTAILGYADLMVAPSQTMSDRLNCLEVIRRNARHLMELINDVLDVSKIEAEMMTVERIDADPGRIVADVASALRPRAAAKQLELRVEFDGPIPQRVRTDPLRLRQILMNLAGNAIKFTHRGRVEIRVRAHVPPGGSAAHGRLRFDIIDSGIGIEADHVERLFKPFVQADESMTRKYGGTGLGLAISKKLANLLGGDIAVSSRRGWGSTFSVDIDAGPLAGVPMLTDLTEAMLQPPIDDGEQAPPVLSARILLAEDGPDNQHLISTVLAAAGADVVVAANGRIAVQSVRTDRFDLVLMDMQMPELDGYGATATLRADGFTLPILALTAHAMAGDREKCIAAGCTDYLTKPIDADRLLRTVAKHLGRSAQPKGPAPAAAAPAATGATADAAPAAAPAPMDPPTSAREFPTLSGAPSPAVAEALRKAVVRFVSHLPERVDRLRQLIDERRINDLKTAVHQLKGSGAGYGFPRVSALAAAAEQQVLALAQDTTAATAAAPEAALQATRVAVDELIALIRNIDGYDPAKEAYRNPPALPEAA